MRAGAIAEFTSVNSPKKEIFPKLATPLPLKSELDFDSRTEHRVKQQIQLNQTNTMDSRRRYKTVPMGGEPNGRVLSEEPVVLYLLLRTHSHGRIDH